MGQRIINEKGEIVDYIPSKEERSRNLRYKKPALERLELKLMMVELEEISEVCADIHWMSEDEEILLSAMDGNEETLWEFKMLFSDMESKCETLMQEIYDSEISEQEFNDCTTGLIGNRYNVIGFDVCEEDYFSLTRYDAELAVTEAGQRFMRLTKKEMISRIGQCMGIAFAYLDLCQQYDYLKATIDILRDENTSFLQVIKDIESLYRDVNAENFDRYGRATKELDSLIQALPDRFWVE